MYIYIYIALKIAAASKLFPLYTLNYLTWLRTYNNAIYVCMYICTQMAEQLFAEGCICEGELL